MNNMFSGFKRLDKIDQFGIATGIIGLVADIVGLSSLFPIFESNSSSSSSIATWIIIFLLLIYSTMLINFFTRRYVWARNKELEQHKISNDQITNFLIKQHKVSVEKAIRYNTYLMVMPIFILYFIFFFLDTGYRAFSDYVINFDIAAIVDGLIVGSFVGWIICSTINSVIRSIYSAIS